MDGLERFVDAGVHRSSDQLVDQPLHLAFARPLAEILTDLAKPVPKRFLAQRKQGGQNLTYIPWHHVNRLLDYFAPGWEGEVTKIVCKARSRLRDLLLDPSCS